MPAAPITETEVTAILSQEMRIDESVQWLPKTDRVYVEASLRVRHPQRNIALTLKLTQNRLAQRKFSISLLLNGAHRIVRLDVNGSHANWHTDSNRWTLQIHEHLWTDACHGQWARSVNVVGNDLLTAFEDFCSRHVILFEGRWADPPAMQLGLGDV